MTYKEYEDELQYWPHNALMRHLIRKDMERMATAWYEEAHRIIDSSARNAGYLVDLGDGRVMTTK